MKSHYTLCPRSCLCMIYGSQYLDINYLSTTMKPALCWMCVLEGIRQLDGITSDGSTDKCNMVDGNCVSSFDCECEKRPASKRKD